MPAARAVASGSAPKSASEPAPPPVERLRKRADFLAAAAGTRTSATGFVLQTKQRVDQGPARVGFTVSAKVGNAVERNRVRRRLREIVRLSDAGRLRPGNDYVLIGRRAALDLSFDRMVEDLTVALNRAHKEKRMADRPAGQGGKLMGQVPPVGN